MTTTAMTFWTELSKPDDGSETDAWGPELITIWDAWDRSLGGEVSISVTSADVTLSTTQAQHGRIVATGSPAAARNLIFPSRNRTFVVRNATAKDLFCYVTGNSDKTAHIAPGLIMSLTTSTDGYTRPIGVQMSPAGGFPATITHPGDSIAGPGIYFGTLADGSTVDREGGLRRPSATSIGLAIAQSEGGDTLRFNAAGSASAPTIGMGPSFTQGFYPDTTGITGGNGMAWGSGGTRRGTIGPGLQVGTPTGGDKGTGTINVAAGYYANNVRLPFQSAFFLASQPATAGTLKSVAHGLAGTPILAIAALRCVATDGTYLASNVVVNSPYILVISNSSNIAYQTDSGGIYVPSVGSGTLTPIVPSKWVIDIYAWY